VSGYHESLDMSRYPDLDPDQAVGPTSLAFLRAELTAPITGVGDDVWDDLVTVASEVPQAGPDDYYQYVDDAGPDDQYDAGSHDSSYHHDNSHDDVDDHGPVALHDQSGTGLDVPLDHDLGFRPIDPGGSPSGDSGFGDDPDPTWLGGS
jgi:hypothetical protein